MKVGETTLNTFQANFLKELMGDNVMPDVRAEATFLKVCAKYSVDAKALVEVVNRDFAVRNAEFNRTNQ